MFQTNFTFHLESTDACGRELNIWLQGHDVTAIIDPREGASKLPVSLDMDDDGNRMARLRMRAITFIGSKQHLVDLQHQWFSNTDEELMEISSWKCVEPEACLDLLGIDDFEGSHIPTVIIVRDGIDGTECIIEASTGELLAVDGHCILYGYVCDGLESIE